MTQLIKKYIPESILEIARTTRTIFRQKHKASYSQSGEDMILNTIFCNIDKGFYVDIGANNPIEQSNTHFFIKRVGVELI